MSQSFLAVVLARAADVIGYCVPPAAGKHGTEAIGDSVWAQKIAAANDLVSSAKSIVILTGAGISTDSGIPDFRGPDGLWTKNPGAEEASHIDVYQSSSAARAANWRMMLMFQGEAEPQPNAGHRAIAALSKTGRLSMVVTQNIDGLHQASGIPDHQIVEVHGGTTQTCCLTCGDKVPMRHVLARVQAGDEDPRCEASRGMGGRDCNGLLKPDVVLFGEQLPFGAIARAGAAVFECDLLIAVGSTLSVHPVAGLVPKAKAAFAKLIIVNRGPTAYDHLADVRLDGSISDLLPPVLLGAASAQARAP